MTAAKMEYALREKYRESILLINPKKGTFLNCGKGDISKLR